MADARIGALERMVATLTKDIESKNTYIAELEEKVRIMEKQLGLEEEPKLKKKKPMSFK